MAAHNPEAHPRLSTLMPDGCELAYFDDTASIPAAERVLDKRQLGTRPPTTTLRQDPLTGTWIGDVAPEQQVQQRREVLEGGVR